MLGEATWFVGDPLVKDLYAGKHESVSSQNSMKIDECKKLKRM